MCFGQPFIWVTDCYAIKYIFTYQGMNPTILRLQMQLMCWAMEIVHQPDIFNVDTDYWSHILMNLFFDQMLREYSELCGTLSASHPAPCNIPMKPENMPYYRGPRILHSPTLPDAVEMHLMHAHNTSMLHDLFG